MRVASNWQDYELIDTSSGEKLERWKNVTLIRPDPQIIWKTGRENPGWNRADAHYHRSRAGGGKWEYMHKLPQNWQISYKDLTFKISPTGFKHTGLFPEQAVNWDWMSGLIKQRGGARVLNLFGYTGGATVACAKAGAEVCHVDAAKGMVLWARENRELSGVDETRVRWIIDDALKFVQREKRRGKTYDGLLMDPPSYGRGPGGEVWKLENELYGLVEECAGVLSDKPLFFLINSYTTGLQPAVLHYMISTALKGYPGSVAAEEIGLPVSCNGLTLPCGASGRFAGQDLPTSL